MTDGLTSGMMKLNEIISWLSVFISYIMARNVLLLHRMFMKTI